MSSNEHNVETGLRCDACGLPPRITQDGTFQALRRCTRCRKVWYHDVNCQKQHFRQHKKTCKASASTANATQLADIAPLLIEKRNGRGNCLVARVVIKKGKRLESQTGYDFWNPLVPPVLLEVHRSTRCALCFRMIVGTPYQYENVEAVPQYPFLFCSIVCRDEGLKKLFDQEQQAVLGLYSNNAKISTNGPPKILPTAIFLYRVLCALARQKETDGGENHKMSSSQLSSQLEHLQHFAPYDANPCSDDELDGFYHNQAVVATVLAMVQASYLRTKEGLSNLLSVENLTKVIGKLKINGFSICDGECIALGIGLYPRAPSTINHSCNPNIIQTFQYGKHQVPTLLLTACRDILPNEEILISYIDNDCPRRMRRDRLIKDYQFWCHCDFCHDDIREGQLVGLRGVESGGNTCNRGKSLENLFQNDCCNCNACTNGELENDISILKKFCLKSSNKDLEQTYETLRTICTMDSWFVQEAGECLVQDLLEKLSDANDKDNLLDQRNYASRALLIARDLLNGVANSSIPGKNPLRTQILALKYTKLELFLCLDPCKAISELHSLLKGLSIYFPSNHEIIEGIKEDLFLLK